MIGRALSRRPLAVRSSGNADAYLFGGRRLFVALTTSCGIRVLLKDAAPLVRLPDGRASFHGGRRLADKLFRAIGPRDLQDSAGLGDRGSSATGRATFGHGLTPNRDPNRL